MKIELYKEAIVRTDQKKSELKKGDLVTTIDYVKKSSKFPAFYTVEVFNFNGKTIGIYHILESDLEPIPDNAIVSIRKLKKAS
ncbi:MAG: hypothetical protein SFU98_07375 [Leptospiraceae bacterium]|nr:hypothetical protein [Leptospiraceae bacterium]